MSDLIAFPIPIENAQEHLHGLLLCWKAFWNVFVTRATSQGKMDHCSRIFVEQWIWLTHHNGDVALYITGAVHDKFQKRRSIADDIGGAEPSGAYANMLDTVCQKKTHTFQNAQIYMGAHT